MRITAVHISSIQSNMEGLEQDINDALESVQQNLDSVNDSVEMLGHTRASNQRLNDLQQSLHAMIEEEVTMRKESAVELRVSMLRRLQQVGATVPAVCACGSEPTLAG